MIYICFIINDDNAGTVMRKQCISENMLVHIAIGIGSFGRAEKRQCNGAVVDIPSVFRIVEDSHAPVWL